MEHRKEVWTVGICTLLLALILRAGLIPAGDHSALSFMMYLQTGRWVRYPEAAAPQVTPTQPQTHPLEGEKPGGISLTEGDLNVVEVNNLTDYDLQEAALLTAPLAWNLTEGGPKVLILHTHTTESYTRQPGEIYEEDSDYRTFNAAYNMISIGKELAQILEQGGISVLHDQTYHDYPSFSGSYADARQTVESYLEAYPSIQVVIDLHRDALDFEKDPQLTTMATVEGQKSAQLMLVAGTDTNASHPNWKENLAVCMKLTAVLEQMHPGITRPIQLRPQRFNLDLTAGSLLVEVGANGNTHQEALVAVRVLGEALVAMSEGVNL
ncbi:MAG: hypothetical protein E7454_05425 [Ruminococcaceae bacterium]|nr:hypothetical protein [Oscillospiraceae bacterium]